MNSITNIDENTKYINGIVENDFAILQQMYKESLPEVVKYVKRNSGTLDDAKDIFQEGILVIFKKAKEGNLTLTTSFHNFLFLVCKRIWLKKLTKKGKKEVPFEEEWEFSFEDTLEEEFLQHKKWKLFHQKFQQLAEECQKVLKMWFNKQSSKTIAQEMGYTEDYAKRKKYKCKAGLTELIKKDALYKDLTAK
ncbi:MAG: sigma-70 family RNA polymerase sigma factor [Bacteroidota bacterium]